MKSEQLLVTTSLNGSSKSEVWDTSRPISLPRPFRWVLENADTGTGTRIRLRSLDDARKVLDLDETGFDHGVDLGQGMNLLIRRPNSLSPAYLHSEGSSADPEASSTISLFAFDGVNRILNSSHRITSAYIGYSRGRPAFAMKVVPHGVQIRSLLEGVAVKFKGQPSQQITTEETFEIAYRDLLTATILWGAHWWRFNLIDRPMEIIDLADPDLFDQESIWYKKSLAAVGALMVALGSAVWFWEIPKKIPDIAMEKAVEIKIQPTMTVPKALTSVLEQEKPKVMKVTEKKAVGLAPPPDFISPPQSKAPEGHAPKGSLSGTLNPGPKLSGKPGGGPGKGLFSSGAGKGPGSRTVAKNTKLLQDALGEVVAAVRGGGPASGGSFGTGKGGRGTPSFGAGAIGIVPGSGSGGLFGGKTGSLKPTQIKPKFATSSGALTRLGSARGPAAGAGMGDGYGGDGGLEAYGSQNGKGTIADGGSFVAFGAEQATVQDGLTKDEVGAVIHAHRGQVRYCHESAMLYQAKQDGKLIIQFTIGSGGAIKTASVESSTMSDSKVEQCLVSAIKGWRFPKPRGGVDVMVSYPFMFRTLGKD